MKKHISTRQLFIEAARLAAKRVKIVHHLPLLMRLDFEDGVSLFTHGNKPDFNREHIKRIARDKDLTARVLQEESIPTPETHFVWMTKSGNQEDEYQKTLTFIERVGYPIFFKLNDGSQGKGVFPISNERELDNIFRRLRKSPRDYIAQEALIGEEYRVVVVRGEILLAYRREPLSVVGNGTSSIAELFRAKKAALAAHGRSISLRVDSEKISLHLRTQGLDVRSVPTIGQAVTLLANKNLSDGAEPVECTDYIRQKHAKLCRDIYEKCGVDYGGIDLIEDTRTGEIRPFVLEINSSPGYKHFIRSSDTNANLVRQVFTQALEALHQKVKSARQASRPTARPKPENGTTDTPHPRSTELTKT